MVLMIEFMTQEEFIKEIEAIGFVKQEILVADRNIYGKKIGNYQVKIDVWCNSVMCWLLYGDMQIASFERLLFNDKTISILKNLLKGFGNENYSENNYTITFNVEDMIKEAEFCGYKINEEQAKDLIDYLNSKADGVYDTIQQYITGYCQNNKFEEIKEEE